MKKLRKITFIVMLSALFCALYFAPDITAKADHTCVGDGNIIILSKPTLISSGIVKENCAVCGEPVYILNLPSISEEDWNMGEITMPTFTSTGSIVYTLKSNEKIVVYFELPVLCDAIYVFTDLIYPDLTTSGEASFYYNNDELSDLIKGKIQLEPLSDKTKWVEDVITDATCASSGEATYTYVYRPQLTFNADIPEKAHVYEWQVETVPTTQTSGLAKHVCKNAPIDAPHFALSLPLPTIPSERVSNENYDFEVVTKPTLYSAGVGKFVYKDSETLNRYEQIFVTVEIPQLVLKGFFVEDGKLYIEYTDGSSECLGTVQGEKGDKGDQGDAGEQGEKGDAGEKGDKGDQGVAGETGQTGPTGATGETGEKGDKGDKGDQGLKGADGENGKSYTGLVATSITVSVISLIAVGGMLVVLLKKKVLF